MKMKSVVLTIGHSKHSLQDFVTLLGDQQVTAVADVRSVPYSRFASQFNRERLSLSLDARDIHYVYLGRELGGRSDDPSCYDGGRIRYDLVARSEPFRSAIQRLVHGSGKYRIALLCAEREPLDCHRTLLVAPALEEKGIEVLHILADGTIERNGETMDRLIGSSASEQGDLFRPQSREELIREAIAHRSRRVGYVNRKLATETSRP